MPADFFRTMEDASGVDLDWFWRGWFYTTDHVDIGIAGVEEFVLDTRDPDVEKPKLAEERDAQPETVSKRLDKALPKLADTDKDLEDFYNRYDELDVTQGDKAKYTRSQKRLEDDERALAKTGKLFYAIEFENHGGLVMPVILDVVFESGKRQEVRIRAEVWRRDPARVRKLLVVDEPIIEVHLDPHLETADTDLSNNHWPPKTEKTRFQLHKERKRSNPMQDAGLGDPKKVGVEPEMHEDGVSAR